MLQIALLVIGIIGLVKGRIAVTKTKELRGTGLYIVSALFIAIFPLSFVAGFILGAMRAGQNSSKTGNLALGLDLAITGGLLLIAFVTAFAMATPKELPPPGDTLPPPPPPSRH